ncbi:MAG TPA: hypothetical protein VG013_22090 [Gemmataceae bacterium]|nr:hypothetical protein [Gemmataceae bacterium]
MFASSSPTTRSRSASQVSERHAHLPRLPLRRHEDADLAGVRDPKAMEKLPPGERDAWQKLWQDVEALLAKTQEKK